MAMLFYLKKYLNLIIYTINIGNKITICRSLPRVEVHYYGTVLSMKKSASGKYIKSGTCIDIYETKSSLAGVKIKYTQYTSSIYF
jgi:hypothetical protein